MSDSWKNFTILYSIQFLQLLDFMSITPLGAIYVKNSNLDSAAISYSLSAYSIAAIISSFLISNFGRKNPKRTLICLLSLFSVSQLVLILPITSKLFISAKVIGGLTGGLMGAISYSQLNNIETGKNTGLWNGRIQTAQSLATIAGIPFCLLIVTNFGSTTYYCFMTVWSVLTVIFFSQSNFIKSTQTSNAKINLNLVWKNMDVLLTGFICYLSSFLFISHMANYLVNHLHVNANELSFSYVISGVITMLLAGTVGRFGEKRAAYKLLGLAIVLISIPQLGFRFITNSSILLYLAIPTYLLLSNARAIYQRAIILQKNAEDSFILHLLNNIAVRTGILSSGLVLGMMAYKTNSVYELFINANDLSMIISLAMLIILIFLSRPLTK